MKQRIILFGLILVGTVTFAQSPVEKGLNTINRSSAEATIGFLASDELQGREAGFHGSYVSSEYIASILQWMGIQPPVSYTHLDVYKRQDYSVKNAAWKNGKGDVVREFVDACEEYGFKSGIYLGPHDRHEHLSPLYTTERYKEYYAHQLGELMSDCLLYTSRCV